MWQSQAYLLCALSPCVCVNLPSLAFSSTVLATMFSSSIKKKKKEKILNAEVFGTNSVCSEYSVLQPVRSLLFPSLLVGVPANFSHIRVVGDKTGCHRFACNVSWAWFLLWAGSAAQHFYSNPSKTIPCVMWLRNEPDTVTAQVWGTDVREPGPLSGVCPAVHQDTTSFTLQEQGLAERTREDISAHPPPPPPPPPPRLVRNQNGLGLRVTAASGRRQEGRPHRKFS